ncbi:hypothetical protein JCM8202_002535 [Rhodotorula sphaerocarpa]
MDVAREQSHMDRLTQTQNSIDDLVRIMYSTLGYLSRKASFKQINEHFPITQSIPGADSPATYEENRKELVGDFLRKAKQLEYLISVLPASDAPPPPPGLASQADGAAPGTGNDTSTSGAPPSAGDATAAATNDGEGPNPDSDAFERLEAELEAVNGEYISALDEAERLQARLQSSLQSVLESRASPAAAAAEAP